MSRFIEKSFTINAPLKQVWKRFESGIGMQSWFPEIGATFEPCVGSRIRLVWTGNMIGTGIITEFVKERKFAFRMATDGCFGEPVTELETAFALREEISERGEKQTVVTLREGEYTDDIVWMKFYSCMHAGWTLYLLNLKSICEGGIDLRNR